MRQSCPFGAVCGAEVPPVHSGRECVVSGQHRRRVGWERRQRPREGVDQRPIEGIDRRAPKPDDGDVSVAGGGQAR